MLKILYDNATHLHASLNRLKLGLKIGRKSLLITYLFLVLTACSGTPHKAIHQSPPIQQGSVASLGEDGQVKSTLHRQHQQWKGVKYAYGGLSKKGIDCSGLVHVTFLEKFNRKIPRSTKQLSKIGKKIRRSALRPGDLVFFKTGVRSRHVGIYIEKEQFLHVSKKQGVVISKLSDTYWKDRYWLARRLTQ